MELEVAQLREGKEKCSNKRKRFLTRLIVNVWHRGSRPNRFVASVKKSAWD